MASAANVHSIIRKDQRARVAADASIFCHGLPWEMGSRGVRGGEDAPVIRQARRPVSEA